MPPAQRLFPPPSPGALSPHLRGALLQGVQGPRLLLTFDGAQALRLPMERAGTSSAAGGEFNFWRAPTDNDQNAAAM